MDAATRVELAGLRRRAYGPEADIDGDAEALLRLVELEDLVRREHLAPIAPAAAAPAAAAPDPAKPARTAPSSRRPSPATPTGAHPATTASTAGAPPPGAPPPGAPPPGAPPPRAPRKKASRPPEPRRPRRLGLTVALVGGALAVAVAAVIGIRLLTAPDEMPDARSTLSPAFQASRAAYSFARDTHAVTLLNIPLDGSFGGFIDLPSDGHVPEFPTTGEVEWAVHLGEYFGWEAWIAGAMVDTAGFRRDHCVLVERGDVTRGRCVPASIRSQSALLVDVPYTFMPAEDRPIGMQEDQRLGFWWRRDQAVTVLLGDDPLR
ncbi:hypothetical protein ACFC1W_07050 [Microbacterium sp. NPDC056003]|uniref:hypothetical protein n=1 Tax=Microbacterium sp. NPDC056003 TaxID=3345676 RepID=UPI0035DE1D22